MKKVFLFFLKIDKFEIKLKYYNTNKNMYPTPALGITKTCSYKCIYNWINYSQKPPRWQTCNCCFKK